MKDIEEYEEDYESDLKKELLAKSELKPCPFCGSHCVFIAEDNHGIYIQCLDCDAQLYHFMDKTDENKLSEIWNRRVKE